MPYGQQFGQQRQAFDIMYPDNKGYGESVEYKKKPPQHQQQPSQQFQPMQPHPQTSQWDDMGPV